jgi:hypothetical protein
MDRSNPLRGGKRFTLRYVYLSVGDGANTLSDFETVGDRKTCLIGAPLIQWHLMGLESQRGQLEAGEVLTITLDELPRRNSWLSH